MPVLAAAQTAPPQEQMAVTVNWQNLQNSIAMLMRVDQSLRDEIAANEAQKATLLEWLKTAQSNEKK